MSKQSALIEGYNLAHSASAHIHAMFADYFAPYLGKKILKADETLLATVRKDLPIFGQDKVKYTFSVSRYSVQVNIFVDIMSEGVSYRAETSVYLLDITNGVLERIYPYESRRSDYSAEFVNSKLAALKEAEETVRNIRRELGPFAPPARVVA